MDAAASDSSNVLTMVADGVLRVEIRRPEKRNALTAAMYQAMIDSIEMAERSAEVRVILLHGQPDAFTSGNDLKDFLHNPALDDEHVAYRFVRAISRATKPIVASVTGSCVGVGATILLHCDLVYAGHGASFALPFVNLGLCPEAGSSLLLPMVAGRARAAELLLLGEPFSAARAEACGMISAVLPDADVLAHAHAQARKLASKPPAAVRSAKTLLRHGIFEKIEEAIRTESHEFQRRLQSPEAKEAFSAFLAKRPPDFSRFA